MPILQSKSEYLINSIVVVFHITVIFAMLKYLGLKLSIFSPFSIILFSSVAKGGGSVGYSPPFARKKRKKEKMRFQRTYAVCLQHRGL